MIADQLLERLDGVRQTGKSQWIACCPAHEDRSPSLSVRECDDGTVLLHDFAGCTALDIVSAVGMDLRDLFPKPSRHSRKPECRSFPAADILRCLTGEIMYCAICANDLARGETLTEADRERLHIAAGRFRSALEAGRLS